MDGGHCGWDYCYLEQIGADVTGDLLIWAQRWLCDVLLVCHCLLAAHQALGLHWEL